MRHRGRHREPDAPVSPQYAILVTMVLTVFVKYVLHSIDLQNENPWDSKAVYMLYTELFTGTAASSRPVSGLWGLSLVPWSSLRSSISQ